MEEIHHRRVRSFVRRAGRVTEAQRSALQRLSPLWSIGHEERKLDLDAVFARKAPRVLDIGFGDGEALVSMAANNPEADFLGVEVHEPGVGHLLLLIESARLSNVRVINRDVVDVLTQMLPQDSFDVTNIFFPDPWPKKRHHKRRLIQNEFLGQLANAMKPGALLHVATDWAGYAEHIAEVLQACPLFEKRELNPADKALATRPPSKFERRGLRLGHEVSDFYYSAVSGKRKVVAR